MNIAEIKKQKEKKTHDFMTECKIFFAFSNEQFEKNKIPLDEGDKYVSIGAGGYMPKSLVKKFDEGLKAINKEYKDAVKEHKLRKENILYELKNREAFYTGEIEETLEALGSDYTAEEVMEVYRANNK